MTLQKKAFSEAVDQKLDLEYQSIEYIQQDCMLSNITEELLHRDQLQRVLMQQVNL
jgi:hypothetical protein